MPPLVPETRSAAKARTAIDLQAELLRLEAACTALARLDPAFAADLLACGAAARGCALVVDLDTPLRVRFFALAQDACRLVADLRGLEGHPAARACGEQAELVEAQIDAWVGRLEADRHIVRTP